MSFLRGVHNGRLKAVSVRLDESSDDEPIALIAKTLETSSMEPKSKKQKTDDTKDDGPTREPPIKPVEQSDRELVAASLNNPLVLSYDPNRAARDASSNRARIRALRELLLRSSHDYPPPGCRRGYLTG